MVFEEAGERKIIFSTFDPDCATLARLKQPRYPVFFLTCAGEKVRRFACQPQHSSAVEDGEFMSQTRLKSVSPSVRQHTRILQWLDRLCGQH